MTTQTQMKHYDTTANALARAIARHFGGTVKPPGRDGELYENWATVHMPACDPVPAYSLGIDLRGWGSTAHKATVRVSPLVHDPDVSRRDLEFPEASFDSRRPMPKLMAEIERRVITNPAAKKSLIEYQERAAMRRDSHTALKAHVEKLQATVPGFQLRSRHDQIGAYNCRFYSYAGVSFDAEVNNDGSISFERISSMDMDTALQIMALLAKKKAR
jgi:hypothetical protein